MLVITAFAIAGSAFETWNRVVFFWRDFILNEALVGYKATAAATGNATPPSSSSLSVSAPNLSATDQRPGALDATSLSQSLAA